MVIRDLAAFCSVTMPSEGARRPVTTISCRSSAAVVPVDWANAEGAVAITTSGQARRTASVTRERRVADTGKGLPDSSVDIVASLQMDEM